MKRGEIMIWNKRRFQKNCDCEQYCYPNYIDTERIDSEILGWYCGDCDKPFIEVKE